MESIIRKWGNSPALRLPSSLLNEAGLAVDQRVRISVVEGSIRIERVCKKPAYRIDDLLAKATADTRHGKADRGPVRGLKDGKPA
ncbi:MAG TPA: AbrB/MazE/SpoVT family DNA-binding domain-containing protein, partial [Burkholderiales bacterium]|nr:AbrB/MazE/SpoVT family DNA-binding domain-containing protein [Burkholderiales bacterium]